MKKLRVLTVVGTRPEIIRLSSLVAELDKQTNHCLVHTGQNSDPNLKDVFFRDLGVREPDTYLGAAAETPAATIGKIFEGIERVLLEFRPDAVMILGDTNSALAAIVCERLHIPVYHMEAGNRSFDLNVPEEINRRIVDHTATFNLAYNSHSRRNLLSEGLHPRFVFCTGSPMREVLGRMADAIEASTILETLGQQKGSYILASFHRQENVDSETNLMKILDGLTRLSARLELPVLVSTHPRTQARLDSQTGSGVAGQIHFHKPFGFLDYCKLQQSARVVISDSGTVSEESAILGFPAVTPRHSMERPEGLEAGNLVVSGLEPDQIESSAVFAIERSGALPELPEGYEVRDFSQRVLNILFSTVHLARKWKNLSD